MKKLLTAIAFLPLLAACTREEPAPVATEPVAAEPVVVAPVETTTATPEATMPPAAQDTEAMPATTMPEPGSGASGSSAMGAMEGSGDGMYVVKAGDTLWGIANRNGIDHGNLAKWNNINDPRELHVGRQLRLTAP